MLPYQPLVTSCPMRYRAKNPTLSRAFRNCSLVGFMLLGFTARVGQLDVGVNRQEVGIGLVARGQIPA